MELLAGKYRNQCWNDGSIFFEEETFGYIEPTIEKCVESYDHYAFTEIAAPVLQEIVKTLRGIKSLLEQAHSVEELKEEVGFFFADSKEQFSESFQENKMALSRLINELSEWMLTKGDEHGSITILGL
ncbi:MAG: hypothetical protein HC887_09210 [Desulfobacteraceae bacterium]|nr:hypothetical protein [Desulfobacteraceae bacterium]